MCRAAVVGSFQGPEFFLQDRRGQEMSPRVLGRVAKCGLGVAWCLGVGEASGVSRVVSSHLVIEPEASVVQDGRRRWTPS